jgi:hypothetical protein
VRGIHDALHTVAVDAARAVARHAHHPLRIGELRAELMKVGYLSKSDIRRCGLAGGDIRGLGAIQFITNSADRDVVTARFQP